MRFWYARRGISWVPLLACLALTLLVPLVLRQWPSTGLGMLTAALAFTAAAAGFAFDEPATAVVSVTPRGAGWRRTVRCAAVLLPVAVWLVVVGTLNTREIPSDKSGLVLAGVGCQLLALGVAALASRHEVAAPGSGVAAGVAVLLLAPLVAAPMLEWDPLLPVAPVGSWVTEFWVGAVALGAALIVRALRPGLR